MFAKGVKEDLFDFDKDLWKVTQGFYIYLNKDNKIDICTQDQVRSFREYNYKVIWISIDNLGDNPEELLNYIQKELNVNLNDILSLQEAAELWNLDDSTLRKAIANKKFNKNEYRKTGRNYILKKTAMERLYGKPQN